MAPGSQGPHIRRGEEPPENNYRQRLHGSSPTELHKSYSFGGPSDLRGSRASQGQIESHSLFQRLTQEQVNDVLLSKKPGAQSRETLENLELASLTEG